MSEAESELSAGVREHMRNHEIGRGYAELWKTVERIQAELRLTPIEALVMVHHVLADQIRIMREESATVDGWPPGAPP